MAETFSVIDGGLFKHSGQTAFKYHCKRLWICTKRILLLAAIFGICFSTTGYIFAKCISVTLSVSGNPKMLLEDCISLGSIFATFGSAIIAFLSLTSAHQLSGFQENVSILNETLSQQGTPNWKRWGFLPRYSRERMADNSYQYYTLKNAELEFKTENKTIHIPIPSAEQDFKDLPVLYNWLKMYKNRKYYLLYVQKQLCIGDFITWDCLMSLYKNIIIYKISQFGIWIGTSYIINSIIFAFFYKNMYALYTAISL